MSASRWKAVLAAFAIFVAGAAVGVLIVVFAGVRFARQATQEPAIAQLIERALTRFETRLADQAGLTPAEAKRLHEELGAAGFDIKRMRLVLLRRVENKLSEALERTAATLPAEKRALFYREAKERLEAVGLHPQPTLGAGQSGEITPSAHPQ